MEENNLYKIEGYEGYKITKDGRVWSDKSKKFLVQTLCNGYLTIVFSDNKQMRIDKMLNIEWSKIAFLSTNSAYNLRSSQIYSLFNI